MTVIALVPVLCALLGAVLYLVPVRPDVKQLALVAFGCGLLVSLFGFASHTIRL